MRFSIVILFALVVQLCYCQDTTKVNYTYTFKVRSPKSDIIVHYEDTAIYTDHKNHFKIEVEGKFKLGVVNLEGGKIQQSGNSFIATVNEGTEAVLVVYLLNPNGKMELGLSKTYKIVHLQQPYPVLANVKADSIAHRNDILKNDFLMAKMNRFNKDYNLKVISFKMEVLIDTSIVKLNSVGDRFSPEMRRHVMALKPGIPLNFTDIFCVMPNGTPRRLKDMTIFVDCSKRYDFESDY